MVGIIKAERMVMVMVMEMATKETGMREMVKAVKVAKASIPMNQKIIQRIKNPKSLQKSLNQSALPIYAL